jgi:hypothetical protein
MERKIEINEGLKTGFLKTKQASMKKKEEEEGTATLAEWRLIQARIQPFRQGHGTASLGR